MPTAKIILYKSKTLKDGKHPVILRVTNERKRIYITLGEGNKAFACTPKEWDEKHSRFNSLHRDYKILNQVLLSIEKDAQEILVRLELDNEEFTFERFETRFRRFRAHDDVQSVFDEEIDRLVKAGRIGYSTVFQSTKSAVLTFAGREKLRLRDIDYKFLSNFEGHILGRGGKKSTISVYMRTLRTMFNIAIKYGYIKEAHYPFASRLNPNGYSLRNLKTEVKPRAITKDDIQKFRDVQLDETSTLFHDHNYFMFSFYCKGISFHDLALLQWSDVNNDRLTYRRAKTGGLLDMALLPPALEILEYYKTHYPSPYLFPIVKEENLEPKVLYGRIKNAIHRYNDNLKEIAHLAGIPRITSYVSRHSWATIMRDSGIPIEIISESMDHKNVDQTVTYLKRFSSDVLDEANLVIL